MLEQNATCGTCQSTWDRANDRYLDTDGKLGSPLKFVSDAPGESHGTTSNEPSEAVSRAEAALKAAEAPGLVEDFIRNLKDEVSRRKEEQLKQRPVGKQLDAAKSALTQTATLMAMRNQKVAAAEARADRAEGRGRCENSSRCGCSDGMMGVIMRLAEVQQGVRGTR